MKYLKNHLKFKVMKLIRNSHIILLVLLLVIFQHSEENPGAWTVDKKINKKT